MADPTSAQLSHIIVGIIGLATEGRHLPTFIPTFVSVGGWLEDPLQGCSSRLIARPSKAH